MTTAETEVLRLFRELTTRARGASSLASTRDLPNPMRPRPTTIERGLAQGLAEVKALLMEVRPALAAGSTRPDQAPVGAQLPDLAAAVQDWKAELKHEIRAVAGRQDSVAVPVEEAAALLGCGRSRIFELLAHGVLRRGTKVGRSTMVDRASIQDLMAKGGEGRVRTRTRRRRRVEATSLKPSSPAEADPQSAQRSPEEIRAAILSQPI